MSTKYDKKNRRNRKKTFTQLFLLGVLLALVLYLSIRSPFFSYMGQYPKYTGPHCITIDNGHWYDFCNFY